MFAVAPEYRSPKYVVKCAIRGEARLRDFLCLPVAELARVQILGRLNSGEFSYRLRVSILAWPLFVFDVFLWKNIFHKIDQRIDRLLGVVAFGH